MSKIKCPECGELQSENCVKEWKYGYVQCFRYNCKKCEKFFNYYISSKGKTWTIPKPKN